MKQMKKGFTLVEVMIAVFIVSLSIGGIFLLIKQTSSYVTATNMRVRGAFLAQEGIEIVRNIRDSNFLKLHAGQPGTWADGLGWCFIGGCSGDYNDTSLSNDIIRVLNLEGGGIYGYGAGQATTFKRTIVAQGLSVDSFQVTVTVSWTEKGGRTGEIRGSTILYNWLNPTP